MSLPIIACPSCKTKMRHPGKAGQIRCPSCQTTLKVSAVAGGAGAPKSEKPKSPGGSGATTIRCPGCSNSLKVSAEMAGKQVRCPSCKKVLRVPGNSAGTSAPRQQTSPKPQAQTPSFSAPTSDNSLFDDFEAGPIAPAATTSYQQAPAPTANPYTTPASPSPYAPPTTYAAPSSGGSKPSGNTPSTGKCWGWLGIASAATFFLCLLAMTVLPAAGAILATLLYLGCALATTVAAIWMLVIAFQESAGQGLMCLFLPFYILVYMFSRWDRCWTPAMIYWIGTAVMIFSIIGVIVGGILHVQIFGAPQ